MWNQKKPSRIVEFLKSQATLGLKSCIGVLFILVMLGILHLIYEIAIQQYRIRRYVATEAKILSSEVIRTKKFAFQGKGWGTAWRYKPQVEYSYVVAGRQYTSSSITMINPYHKDEKWAKKIAGKYRSNMTTTAYYNPNNPQKSFLMYEVAFWPYQYALICFTLLCVSATIYTAIRKIYHKPKVPDRISENYYGLLPDNIKKTFKKAIVVCFFYYFVGIVLGVLYFSMADKPYELFPQIMYCIYFLLGLIPICYLGYDTWQSRDLQSPEVLIDQPHLQVGKKIRIKVTQKFKKAVELVDTEIVLVCATYYKSKDKRGNDCVRSRDDVISKAILYKERFLMADDLLKFEDDILVPQYAHKSGFSEEGGELPFFYRWYFRITNTQANGFAYTTKYFVSCE